MCRCPQDLAHARQADGLEAPRHDADPRAWAPAGQQLPGPALRQRRQAAPRDRLLPQTSHNPDGGPGRTPAACNSQEARLLQPTVPGTGREVLGSGAAGSQPRALSEATCRAPALSESPGKQRSATAQRKGQESREQRHHLRMQGRAAACPAHAHSTACVHSADGHAEAQRGKGQSPQIPGAWLPAPPLHRAYFPLAPKARREQSATGVRSAGSYLLPQARQTRAVPHAGDSLPGREHVGGEVGT